MGRRWMLRLSGPPDLRVWRVRAPWLSLRSCDPRQAIRGWLLCRRMDIGAAAVARVSQGMSALSAIADRNRAAESWRPDTVVQFYLIRTRITFRSYSASICRVISTPPVA